MTKDKAYFTYAHFRKSDNKIFYIGKGKSDRHLSRQSRNEYWLNTVKKHGLIVEKLCLWPTEQEAFDHEKFLIQCFKDLGYKLTNMTDGGEGLSNPSIEVRQKLSEFNAMKRPEIAIKVSRARKGVKLSPEHIAKLSKVQTGRKLSEATREKMSARFKTGLSEETKQKMSESAKKAWNKRKDQQ